MIRAVRRTWKRAVASLLRRGGDTDLAEELESHIQLMAEEHMQRGLSREEAYRRARLRFGSVETAKEAYRDQRGLPSVESVLQDLRYAARGFRRAPGFAIVAVVSLAIGIGANAAIFSLVNGVLLRPLGYQDPERVFVVREFLPHLAGQQSIPVNPLHARQWAQDCPSLEQVALMRSRRVQLVAGGDPAFVPGADVPHNLFTLLGVEPILGRAFLADEEQAGRNNVVMLSESLWRGRFNADRSLIGTSILLDGEPNQIVGIVPAGLRLPFAGGMEVTATNTPFDIFRPLVLSKGELARPMGNFNYGAVVRVRRGATADQALSEINVVEARLPGLTGVYLNLRGTLIPARELFVSRARLGLWMLAAAVGAVLLIVCVNLANLLLSRNASRKREAAIRTALGASRARQFRQVLTESVLLAVAGGALGLLLASWIVRLLLATTTLDIPRLHEVRLDATVLAFSLCLTLLTGLLFGVLPAWRLSRGDPHEALRAGSHTVTEGRRGLRIRESLIGIEVGLSAALLIVAGLLATSLTRLLHVDKGFDVENVLAVDVGLAGNIYADPAVRERFFERLLTSMEHVPGVQAAGFITALPTRGETWMDPIYLEGGEHHSVNNRYASPGYFRAMNIAIRSGRSFEERDRGNGVAVLSEKAAQILWPGDTDPIGRRFIGEDDKEKTLVGIAADVRAALQSAAPATAYYPYWQRPPGGGSVVIRTTDDWRTAAGALRAAIRGEDAQLPMPVIRSMAAVVDLSVAQRRFQATLMLGFAAAALLVASLGIYGVVSYSVARRRNEIGIRMALGAQRSRLLGLVLRQGMAPVALGLAAGVGVALALGRAIRGLLFDVRPTDPATIAGVSIVLLAVGALACLIPARRATRTDAIRALRLD